MTVRWIPAASLLALAAGSTIAAAQWMVPGVVPVERLVRNLDAYVRENPEDAQGYYILGRVHGLAFVRNQNRVWGSERADQLPWLLDRSGQFYMDENREAQVDPGESPDEAKSMGPKVLWKHLRGAVMNMSFAVDHAPDVAHYHLGLAYILEKGAHLAVQVNTDALLGLVEEITDERRDELASWIQALTSSDAEAAAEAATRLRAWPPGTIAALTLLRTDPDPVLHTEVEKLLREYWLERALDEYHRAYSLAIEDDLALETKPLEPEWFEELESLTGYEAGRSFVRLATQRGVRSEEEREKIASIEANLKVLREKPDMNAITPIVFSLESERSLDDLLDPEATVRFDLDGDGEVETWPWVRPDTGILVWDPEGRAEITSGRQLFGSVTWWMFFEDGYHALDALDDDRNGWLEGGELAGLSVWFDRDGDGTSTSGEVTPLDLAGIEALAVRATTLVGRSPANPCGLRLTGGETRPTYDWVTSPVAPAP